MSRIRGKDTEPELAVRKRLHARGLRYRTHHRPEPSLRRTADITFPRAKVAVFIDGCFWHRCPEHHRPASKRAEFWAEKIAGNVARDEETSRLLRAEGWAVLRFWEHEDPGEVADRIEWSVRVRGYGTFFPTA